MARPRSRMTIREEGLIVKDQVLFCYPAICRAVRPPPQNSVKAKKLGGGRAARKSPVGEG
ncbi:hypothetical protein DPQ31_05370 [Bacillus sp. COPE52]|nr:hypothetical protein DPQ31_05370 [Bacillus sp. COPE52]